MADDVPEEEKERRFRVLEDQQARITAEINARYLGQLVEVLGRGKAQEQVERPHPNQ